MWKCCLSHFRESWARKLILLLPANMSQLSSNTSYTWAVVLRRISREVEGLATRLLCLNLRLNPSATVRLFLSLFNRHGHRRRPPLIVVDRHNCRHRHINGGDNGSWAGSRQLEFRLPWWLWSAKRNCSVSTDVDMILSFDLRMSSVKHQIFFFFFCRICLFYIQKKKYFLFSQFKRKENSIATNAMVNIQVFFYFKTWI